MYILKLVRGYDEFEFKFSNVIDVNRFMQAALKHSFPDDELEVRIKYVPCGDASDDLEEDDEDAEIL